MIKIDSVGSLTKVNVDTSCLSRSYTDNKPPISKGDPGVLLLIAPLGDISPKCLWSRM